MHGIVEPIDPAAYARYEVRMYTEGDHYLVRLVTSDRTRAYHAAAEWEKNSGTRHDVVARPSKRYLQRGGYV